MHFISEYVGDNDRTVIVAQDEKGFLVELYKGNELVETRTVYEHSEAYAEDLAETGVKELYNVRNNLFSHESCL